MPYTNEYLLKPETLIAELSGFLFPGNIGIISIPHHQMRNTWQSDVTCEVIWLLVCFQDLVDQEWCRRTRG